MCIIIVGKPVDITEKIITRAYNGNKDGFGLMYVKDGKIISEKFYAKKLKSILKCFKRHAPFTEEIALHFRYATQGDKNNFNCHPFIILNKKLGDNFDLSLMHNSPTLPAPILDTKKSDTYFFSRYILKPIIKNKPELLFNEDFIKTLEKIINAETTSKVLLLNSFNGKFNFLGEWHDFEKLKVSQTYSIKEFTYTYSSELNKNNYYDYGSYVDDFYGRSFNFEDDKKEKRRLIYNTLKKRNKKKNKKDLYLEYQNISHTFDNGNKKDIFKLIKNLNHKEIADLITELRDDKKILDQVNNIDSDEEDTIQVNDLKYGY